MKNLNHLLFPSQPRNFFGKRWIQISLRTAHLIGIAGFSGGVLLGVEPKLWIGFLHLTLLSGLSYFLLDIYCNAMALIQVRGVTIFIKMALLSTLYYNPEQAWIVLWIIIISSIISHAPGNLRYFSLLHWKRVDVRGGAQMCGRAAKST